MDKPDDFWKNALWTDETKLELFSHNDVQKVWRKTGEAFNPKCTIPTMKCGGGNIMLWGALSANETGKLVRVVGRMKKEDYCKILEENLRVSVEMAGIGDNFIFVQDNDPKHTSEFVMNWLSSNRIEVLDWPSMNPDLNPIENLWRELKVRVMARKPQNLKELEDFAREE